MARGIDKDLEKEKSLIAKRSPFVTRIKSREEIKAEQKAAQKKEKQKEQRKEDTENRAAQDKNTPLQSQTNSSARASLLQGLTLDILDPLRTRESFEYILDSSKAKNLKRTPLLSGFELVSWRETESMELTSFSEQKGILYKDEMPIGLITYDETDESFVIYGQDEIGQAQIIANLPTAEYGFIRGYKTKRHYRQNPERALAQDIYDLIASGESRGKALYT